MAFRTRCPSCATLFSAPDDMVEKNIKCPRCKTFFIAKEEEPGPVAAESSFAPPGGALPSEQRPSQQLPSEQRPPGAPVGAPPKRDKAPEFFCKVCDAGFTEDDILDGIAIRRYDDVYCRKHFQMNFPDECEQHPGTKAVTECGRCGTPLCSNCVVELQDERLCSRCKRRVLHELRGHEAPGEAFGYGERPGLPWDRDGGFMERLVGTIKEVLFSPNYAFQKMRLRGNYGRPLLFGFMLIGLGSFLGSLWMLLIMGAGSSFFSSPGMGQAAMPIGVFVVMYFFQSAIAGLVGPFISAAIYHVCLLIVKGAKRDFECTYRVIAYASGSTAVFNLIPIIGQLIGAIWAIVAIIIGFSRAHGISGGKAALAYFLPLIVCGGGAILLIIVVLVATAA